MWWIASLGGVSMLVSGLLPADQALDVLLRTTPILVFLIAITVVAELADRAEVFDAAAGMAARAGRGSVLRLFLLVVVLASMTTAVLSLDTTAVLLTPVILSLVIGLELPALPFAMVTVWLANTASLLLPVSNLTNLLAMDQLAISPLSFTARMWLPALIAVGVTVLVVGLRYRRDLSGRYQIPEPITPVDPLLFRTAAGVCIAVGPMFLTGVPPWAVASVAAVILAAVFAVRRHAALRLSLLPWRLVLLVLGLFLLVRAATDNGLGRVLEDAAGTSDSFLGSLQLSGLAAVTSNVANNLPAYLALESTAGSTPRLLAVLIGTNLGPLVLLWGSLATLLWRERCLARGIHVGAGQFALLGLLGVPPLLILSCAALVLT